MITHVVRSTIKIQKLNYKVIISLEKTKGLYEFKHDDITLYLNFKPQHSQRIGILTITMKSFNDKLDVHVASDDENVIITFTKTIREDKPCVIWAPNTLLINYGGMCEGEKVDNITVDVSNGKVLTENLNLHVFHINHEWFQHLVSKAKVIEGRLYDEKRRRISRGDYILFKCRDDETIYCRVLNVRVYDSFKDMLTSEGLDKVLPGVSNVEEGVKVYRRYYSEIDERTYGVIALELEAI